MQIELTAFFKFPLENRVSVYTTNVVESYHRMEKKSTNSHTLFFRTC